MLMCVGKIDSHDWYLELYTFRKPNRKSLKNFLRSNWAIKWNLVIAKLQWEDNLLVNCVIVFKIIY